MHEHVSMVAYWGVRRESADACAQRLSRWMLELAGVHELLATWQRRGRSRATAIGEIPCDPAELRQILIAGRNRTDIGSQAIEELGFRLGMWNGNDKTLAELDVHCGAYTSKLTVPNSCKLQLPDADHKEGGDPLLGDLYSYESASAIVRAAADCWQPDWATLGPRKLHRDQNPIVGAPYVGWLTYLSDSRPIPQDLPTHIGIERLAYGTLLTLAPSLDTVTSTAAQELHDQLNELGALYPINTSQT